MSETQSELTLYPDSPGYKTGGTSADAAAEMASRAVTLRGLVLERLKVKASTADEMALHLGESILSIRPRFSELLAVGAIEWTGDRRKNASGKMAKVWMAAR